jgi:hypothetical protein
LRISALDAGTPVRTHSDQRLGHEESWDADVS